MYIKQLWLNFSEFSNLYNIYQGIYCKEDLLILSDCLISMKCEGNRNKHPFVDALVEEK